MQYSIGNGEIHTAKPPQAIVATLCLFSCTSLLNNSDVVLMPRKTLQDCQRGWLGMRAAK